MKLFPGKYFWLLSAFFCLIDLAWVIITGQTILVKPLLFLIICNLMLLTGAWFYRQVRNEPQFTTLFLSVSYLSFMTAALGLSSYMFTSFALPLHDGTYAYIDQLLGFDWVSHLQFTNEYPMWGKILYYAYHSSMAQIILLLVILSFTKSFDELGAFLKFFTIAGLTVITTAGLFPSIGPYAYYNVSPEVYSNLNPVGGQWHLEIVKELRQGTLKAIDISKLEGLVPFPSFHTCLAIGTSWFLRKLKYIFPVALVLNILVIISTLTEGGHYLIDIIGGGFIAITVIYLLSKANLQTTLIEKSEKSTIVAT